MKNKILGIIIGVAITVSVIGFINVTIAHTGNTADAFHDNMPEMMHDGNHNDMQELMHGMHSHMHNEHFDTDDMPCMSMDIDEMDADGDGFCDICGMSIEHCKSMRNGCSMMH